MKYLNEITLQAWCKLRNFSREEKGASGIEYVLIASVAVLAIALFVGDGSIGVKLQGILDGIKDAIAPGEETP